MGISRKAFLVLCLTSGGRNKSISSFFFFFKNNNDKNFIEKCKYAINILKNTQ